MNSTTASFLIRASSRCILTSDTARSSSCPMPLAEDLLPLELCGGRTVPRGDGTSWKFSFDKMDEAILDGVLFEDPDTVAGKYVRGDYEFLVFGGDKSGGVVSRSTSHAVLYKNLVTDGVVVRGMGFSRFANYSVADPHVMVGRPAQYLNSFAGVILPKQNGVDGTYISFWQSRSKWPIAWAKKHFDGPFFTETELPTGGWGLHGRGHIMPI